MFKKLFLTVSLGAVLATSHLQPSSLMPSIATAIPTRVTLPQPWKETAQSPFVRSSSVPPTSALSR